MDRCNTCLPVGSNDKRLGAEGDIDQQGSPGRIGSDCGDQREERLIEGN